MSFRFNHFLAATCFLLTTQVNAEQNVNIYNWSEYLPQHLIEKFTKETGIKVNYSENSDNKCKFVGSLLAPSMILGIGEFNKAMNK